MTSSGRPGRRIVIEAGAARTHYWADLWRYRELFYFLAWRDLLVRYKQTLIGVSWTVLRPLVTMAIFTIVFGKLAKLPADNNVPYALFVFAGILPWQLFANVMVEVSNSLVSNSAMVTKIYFPRLIVPASCAIVGLVDFVISLVIFGLVMAWCQFVPGITALALPFFIIMTVVVALGVGVWFSALNVRYRDVRHFVPFVVQFGLYVSPVGFSSTLIPEPYRALYFLNPMAGVIDGFRWALLGTPLNLVGLAISTIMAVSLLVGGVAYFRRAERRFADVI